MLVSFLAMSPNSSPRDFAELTIRRLNRAATDLGLTLHGRPLFVLEYAKLDDDVHGDIHVFDISLNAVEFEDYAVLATALEKLAENPLVLSQIRRLDRPMAPPPGSTPLPGL